MSRLLAITLITRQQVNLLAAVRPAEVLPAIALLPRLIALVLAVWGVADKDRYDRAFG